MGRVAFGIPVSTHHLVIGKNGSTIRSLEKECQVSISIEQNDPVVVVEGEDKGTSKAERKLTELLGAAPVPEGEELCTITLDVPASRYGRVIGKRGKTLFKIQTDSGCLKLTVSDNEGCIVEGTKFSCHKAKELIDGVVGNSSNVLSEECTVVDGSKGILNLGVKDEIAESIFFPDSKDNAGLYRFLTYLKSVKKTLDVCVFSITDDRISRELINAHRRGVAVRVITDDDQAASLGSDIATMKKSGIPLRTDHSEFHMHHKFAILDSKVLINGSFNWTRNASSANNENIMITNDSTFIGKFEKYFAKQWKEFA